MNLLAGKLYDPGTAVNKVTTGLLALTALDTTNLRLAFVVPPSGIVRVRLSGVLHGATTYPQIVLGVLEGSTVRGRQAPILGGGNLAATTLMACWAEFVVTGLTPGASLNWDAAYGVETVVASTGLKYGGPNNTTGNDNFGGFVFEIWDPCPGYTPTAGTAPTSTVHAKLDARLPTALVSGRIDASVGAMAANVLTAAAINADAITDAKVASDVTIASVTGSVGSVTGAVGSVTGAVGSVTAAVSVTGDFTATMKTSIGTAVAASAVASVTGNVGGNVTGSVGSVTGLTAADVGLIKAKTDNLPSDPADQSLIIAATDQIRTDIAAIPAAPSAAAVRAEIDANSTKLDAAVSTRLAAADYVAPDNAGVAAIQAKTDSLTFTVAGKLDVNVLVVNGVTITGAGTAGSPWGPA